MILVVLLALVAFVPLSLGLATVAAVIGAAGAPEAASSPDSAQLARVPR